MGHRARSRVRHDPTTGTKKRKQKWVTFRGTQKQAEAKLTDLVGKVNRREFVEPVKTTLVEYLRYWLERSIKPSRRPATYRLYRIIVEHHIATSTIAHIPLQQIRESDLEAYHATRTGKASSTAVHHALFHSALLKAVKERLLAISPATDVDNRPRTDANSGHGARCTAGRPTRRGGPERGEGLLPANRGLLRARD